MGISSAVKLEILDRKNSSKNNPVPEYEHCISSPDVSAMVAEGEKKVKNNRVIS
jgi:hypothetical protein